MSRPERHVDNITDLPRSCRLRENTSGRRPLSLSSRLFKIPINWSADSFQLNTSPRWVDTWARDMVMWCWCFDSCQLTILWMSKIQDMDLPRHAWGTPPSLLIVSLTPPLQSVDAYVRTYLRSVNQVTITWRKEVDHILWVWGSVPRAPRYK